MALYDFLEQWLRDEDLTASQFARRAHISVGLVYKWLSPDPEARITPGPSSCRKIAAVVGVDPDRILELAGHREPRDTSAQDLRREAVHTQLDRWLDAVDEDDQPVLWQQLKTQGDSTVALLQYRKTAVNGDRSGAVNGAVKRPALPQSEKESAAEQALSKISRPSSNHFSRRPAPVRQHNQPLAA